MFCLPVYYKKRQSLILKIHTLIILPVVLYECEIWSLTLREECRLRVSEIFRLKKDKSSMEKTT